MKTLTLLRHAKSSWNDETARDFDRPLNVRGRRAAHTVGREMSKLKLQFDLVLASPAVRVAETLREVEGGYGRTLGTRFDQRIYLAAPEALLDIVHSAPESASSLLLVGHNPGLEMLALRLTGKNPLRAELAIKYPTGTLAEIAFPVAKWSELQPGAGMLTRFVRPRDLDPELGPDDES